MGEFDNLLNQVLTRIGQAKRCPHLSNGPLWSGFRFSREFCNPLSVLFLNREAFWKRKVFLNQARRQGLNTLSLVEVVIDVIGELFYLARRSSHQYYDSPKRHVRSSGMSSHLHRLMTPRSFTGTINSVQSTTEP
jgi:hypothetical protein